MNVFVKTLQQKLQCVRHIYILQNIGSMNLNNTDLYINVMVNKINFSFQCHEFGTLSLLYVQSKLCFKSKVPSFRFHGLQLNNTLLGSS